MGRAINLSQQLYRSIPAWATLVVLLALAGIVVEGFLLPEHLLALGQQVAPLVLVAVGQTFAILTGGLDLSVGSVVTLSLVLVAGISGGQESHLVEGVLASLGAGLAVGLANGLIVVRLRTPPLVATLATMSIVQGIAWVYTSGAPKGSVPNSLQFVANGSVLKIPVADLVVLFLVGAAWLALARTLYGRRLFATGANRAAANLSGVNTSAIVVLAYTLCGLFAALGGLMLAGYIGVGTLDVGSGYILNSIAVVIIGGTTFTGGVGGVVGTVAGVGVFAVLTSLLIQAHTPVALRSVLLSAILVIAAILHARRERR